MYYDGALVGGPTAKTGTLTGAGSIKIGQYGFPSGTGITGDLDEAAVYNVALSAATVSAHYAARLGATGPTTPGWTLGVKIV
jgi:hypothetical protein